MGVEKGLFTENHSCSERGYFILIIGVNGILLFSFLDILNCMLPSFCATKMATSADDTHLSKSLINVPFI